MLKYTILNYQFFNAYRVPLSDSDKVISSVSATTRGISCENATIMGLNTSGLNFKSFVKFKNGEEVKLTIRTQRLFDNWDFELTGQIVRTFIDHEHSNMVVYGVLFNKESNDDVLNYFLKDLIGDFSNKRLTFHLLNATLGDRKHYNNEALELYSLFSTMIYEVTQREKDISTELIGKYEKYDNYFIHLYDDNRQKLVPFLKKQNAVILDEVQNTINLSYHNEKLVNISINNEDGSKAIEKVSIMAIPIYNKHKDNIGTICVTKDCESANEVFNFQDENKLRSLAHIISTNFEDFKSHVEYQIQKDHQQAEDFFLGKSKSTVELYHTVNILKDITKNILITGENGLRKEKLADYIHQQSKYKDFDLINIDLSTLDKVDLFFKEISNDEYHGADYCIVNEIHLLSIEQQNKLYDFIKNTKKRTIVISSRDLKQLVNEGKLLKRLYLLISQFILHIQPIRNRRSDIKEISNLIIEEEAKLRELSSLKISERSMSEMLHYQWPENLKELRNKIKKEVIKLGSGQDEQVIDIPLPKTKTMKPVKNQRLFQMINNLVFHSDNSISYEEHIQTLKHHLQKNKKAS